MGFDRPDSLATTYIAERVRVHGRCCLSEALLETGRLDIRSHYDEAIRAICIDLSTYIHGMPKETISVHRRWPKTWLDAFKERWYPKWLLSRYPAEYERIDIEQRIFHAICPHLHDNQQGTHLQWMAAESRPLDRHRRPENPAAFGGAGKQYGDRVDLK